MLSQFSQEGNKTALGDLYDFPKDVYPVGRLDADSEGLLILTNDKSLNQLLLNPKNQHQKTYWAQVEGEIDHEAIEAIKQPMLLKHKKTKFTTLPSRANILNEPKLPERNPPIRFRKNNPTSWLSLTITEGKNRQVRKMTAKVGFPTLRLIRYSIEDLNIENMNVGKVIELEKKVIYQKLKLL